MEEVRTSSKWRQPLLELPLAFWEGHPGLRFSCFYHRRGRGGGRGWGETSLWALTVSLAGDQFLGTSDQAPPWNLQIKEEGD